MKAISGMLYAVDAGTGTQLRGSLEKMMSMIMLLA